MTVVVLAVLLAAVAALPWSQQQTHQQPLPENRSVSSRGGFPDDIWQWSTFDADPMPDGHSLPSRRCTAINPAHKHEILSHGDALAHARRASLDDDRVPHEVETLQHSPLWDDLVRYLLLLIHGGTSTNLDTVCETHATPEQLAQASLVVAVEYDDLSHPQAWIDDAIPVSLMRSTLMAKPGSRTLQRVLHRLVVEMLVLENRRLASLGVSNDAVQSTGRAVLTDTLLENMSEQTGRPITYADIKALTAPTLWGDVLILPKNSFRPAHAGDNPPRHTNL